MFVDRVKIHARGGQGGRGCVSFRREKYIPRGGPDGGPGGDGGSVILVTDPDTDHLTHLFYQPNQFAKRGVHGRGKQMDGKKGADLIVKVPPGTLVTQLPGGETVVDMDTLGARFVLCKGGRGGRGNMSYKSSTHQAPREYEEGEMGEEGQFELILKIVADISIIGFPNAGKSTLLTKLSKARPKVASYPFTTLQPMVGILEFEDYHTLRVADVPGLIEGASQDRGLGHDFLRHIERSKFYVVVLDTAATEGREPWDDYKTLMTELKLYRPELLKRPRLVIANKMDLPGAEEKLVTLRKKVKERILPMAAEKDVGIGNLIAYLHEFFFEKQPAKKSVKEAAAPRSRE